MSESTPAARHHRIDYIEFSVTDLQASKAFYSQVFGWAFTDYGPGYCGIQGQGKEVGGFQQVDAVQSGGPLVVLYSSDVQATLLSVKQAGGQILKEVFDFPGGQRFEFADPSGNHLAVWTET